ncbi:alpha/beta hydrolase [Streptococcus massiliensis]|uniref:Hydrolase n=1 Tax=Streptococcus massiliensis TaxID=313439 RepID=A0A380KWM1_9STRE|nr:alpha/beta hydrolase [Streptococcus massiliensis]SUN76065.1 hydrolase [Streptococcus massiliensis]
MKKTIVITGMIFVLLSLAGFIFFHVSANAKLDKRNYHQEMIPTLFFHGFGSSYRAEQHMTNAAKEAGVTKTIIRADVDDHGQVKLSGDIPKDAINPIVQVSYADNRNPDKERLTLYATNVVKALQNKYGFAKINMVAHSLGNLSILYYLQAHGHDKSYPQVMKMVNIANTVNGLEGLDLPDGLEIDEKTGRPSKMTTRYRQLLSLRDTLPKDQIDVLNIYGDKDGTGSDGSVINTSSRSLKYLMAETAKSYQEKKFTGAKAQHSQLHENPEVDKVLIDFIWGK